MINDRIYESFTSAYKDYNSKIKSDHWKIKNKYF